METGRTLSRGFLHVWRTSYAKMCHLEEFLITQHIIFDAFTVLLYSPTSRFPITEISLLGRKAPCPPASYLWPSENHQRGQSEPTPRWGLLPFLCDAQLPTWARRQHPLLDSQGGRRSCWAAALGPRRAETWAQTTGSELGHSQEGCISWSTEKHGKKISNTRPHCQTNTF